MLHSNDYLFSEQLITIQSNNDSLKRNSFLKDASNLIHRNTTPKKKTFNEAFLFITPIKTPTKKTKYIDFKTIEEKHCSIDFKKQLFTPENFDKQQDDIYFKTKLLFSKGTDKSNSFLVDDKTLISRERESNFLHDFILNNLSENTSNNLFIDGPCGSGKTAQVNATINYFIKNFGVYKQSIFNTNLIVVKNNKTKILKLNCMILINIDVMINEIFNSILGTNLKKEKITLKNLISLLTLGSDDSNIDSVIIVMDEIDFLLTKNCDELFGLLNFVSNNHKLKIKVVLIGISNSLNFEEKFQPKIKKNRFSYESLHFFPYSSAQIKSILEFKLKKISNEDNENVTLFDSSVIEFLSKKVGSSTGDLRKAFDICYKSIELLEMDNKVNANDENTFHLRSKQEFKTTIPKVTVSLVAKVCSDLVENGVLKKIKNLSLMQKAVLCLLFNYKLDDKHFLENEGLTVDESYNFFSDNFADIFQRLLTSLKKCEFVEIISALESLSVISLSPTKNNRKSKLYKSHNVKKMDFNDRIIKLNCSFDDFKKSILNIDILKKIFNNVI